MDQTRTPLVASQGLGRGRTMVMATFTTAVFASALLLFAVEPMFARMVLPKLGGSPSVWSVAMVFFQSMLFAGYAYAHLLVLMRRPRLGALIHVAILVVAGLTLPLSVAASWGSPPAHGEALWLLGLFTASIGLPFFALAANNPLLQAWLVDTQSGSSDPYFLYAASNFGSFLALLCYPALLEPLLTLRAQNILWTGGFAVLVVLVGACGALLVRSRMSDRRDETAAAETAPPTALEIGRWIFLAAIPSGLLVAVTAQISTDVAAVPLLWVVPLALYLLSWVVVFQGRPLVPHRWAMRAQPVAIVALVVALAWREPPLLLTLGVHLAAFSVIALACHGQLAQRRPEPRHLTTFYLSLSAGGAIGGLFSGLLAPFTFSWIAEYPILIGLAALTGPFRRPGGRGEPLFWALAALALLLVTVPRLVLGWAASEALGMGAMAIAAASLVFARDALRFALGIALALVVLTLNPESAGRYETVRSFFGVHKIWETADGKYRVLEHGTTIHGAQRIRNDAGEPMTGRPEPLTYYHADSAMAEAIRAVRARKGGPLKVAVVGLGTGSLACQKERDEAWTYFEIDPDVVQIAKDPRRFTFLQSCAPDIPVVVGDARLTLAKEPDGAFDLIVVDAFSSDSIPVHLLTQEAMAVYKSKVGPQGAVMMHISNRHLELVSVVAGIAAANGLKTWVRDEDEDEREDEYIFDSTVALSAADAADVGAIAANENWEATEPDLRQRTWTDDYSNIVGALVRKWRE